MRYQLNRTDYKEQVKYLKMPDTEDIFETVCFSVLCVTSIGILVYQSNFDTLMYLSTAMLCQSQYGLWTLVTKGVQSDLAGTLAQLSDSATYYFNLPLIAAQTCYISLDIKPIDGITSPIICFLVMAPVVGIIMRMLSSERPYHKYTNKTIQLISLGFLIYVTYELDYPRTAAAIGLIFFANEWNNEIGQIHDRATLLSFSNVVYGWWLTNLNMASIQTSHKEAPTKHV